MHYPTQDREVQYPDGQISLLYNTPGSKLNFSTSSLQKYHRLDREDITILRDSFGIAYAITQHYFVDLSTGQGIKIDPNRGVQVEIGKPTYFDVEPTGIILSAETRYKTGELMPDRYDQVKGPKNSPESNPFDIIQDYVEKRLLKRESPQNKPETRTPKQQQRTMDVDPIERQLPRRFYRR